MASLATAPLAIRYMIFHNLVPAANNRGQVVVDNNLSLQAFLAFCAVNTQTYEEGYDWLSRQEFVFTITQPPPFVSLPSYISQNVQRRIRRVRFVGMSANAHNFGISVKQPDLTRFLHWLGCRSSPLIPLLQPLPTPDSAIRDTDQRCRADEKVSPIARAEDAVRGARIVGSDGGGREEACSAACGVSARRHSHARIIKEGRFAGSAG